MSDDVFEIELEERTAIGKGVKHLRSTGKVPAVIHNHGKDSIIVQGDGVSLLKIYKKAGKHHPIEVKAGGKTYTTLIKDAEFEPRKHRLNHLVFNAVAADQVVEAEVPIEPRYDEGNDASPAERAGLMVLHNLEAVTVEAVPKNIPDVLYFNAEKLVEVGDHILISDLDLPAGVTIKEEPGQSIVSVFEPSAVAAANDAAGGTAEEEAETETEETTEGEPATDSEQTSEEGKDKSEES
jgi:large subunit ribosomal protein L25